LRKKCPDLTDFPYWKTGEGVIQRGGQTLIYPYHNFRETDKRPMNKQCLPFLSVALFMAVLSAGCQSPAPTPTPETVGNLSGPACPQVDFLGVTESSEVTSTWRYRVQEQSCAQSSGSWTLELPSCATVVDASPGPWEIVGPGADSQLGGIRWQTGSDFQSGEFSVTLTGDLDQGMTRVAVKAGNQSTSRMDGPICKGQPSASVSVPTAKVKVQSANCRAQPVGKAGKVSLLYRNQEAEIVGKNDDPNNPWWYVRLPDQGGNCWLWGKTTTTTGDLDGLPVVK
jgi:hypothetical protein